MDPLIIEAAIAAAIKVAVDLGPTVIKAVEDATPFAKEIMALFSGTNVTQADLDALSANILSLSTQLQTPLPPAAA